MLGSGISSAAALMMDRELCTLGFSVAAVRSGHWEGVEQTRAAVLGVFGEA